VFKNVIVQAARPLSGAEEHPARIGFTATKRLGKAYIRNRTKRRLRAVMREIYESLALPNVDYVLVGRFDTYSCPFADLHSDIVRAFKKANKTILSEQTDNEKNNPAVD